MAILGVDDFKSKIRGGGARPNLFKATVNFPTYAAGDVELTSFMCKGAQLPASVTNVIDVPFRGRQLKVAGDRTFEPWTVTIINDTDFVIRDAMEKWSNSINDLQTAQGTISPEVYQRNALVTQLSREGTSPSDPEKVLRTYKFEGIYPNTVSSIPLDFGATDQIEEFQVTFNYLFYEVASPTGNF